MTMRCSSIGAPTTQAYVRDRLLAFAVRDPTFAQLLGVEPRAVEQAVAATFAQRAAREAAASSDRQLALVFNHDCMCAGALLRVGAVLKTRIANLCTHAARRGPLAAAVVQAQAALVPAAGVTASAS